MPAYRVRGGRHRPLLPRCLAIGAASTLAAAIAGCGGGGVTKHVELTAATYAYLTQTGVYATDAAVVEHAHALLTERCAVRAGLPRLPVPAPSAPANTGGDAPAVVTTEQLDARLELQRRAREGFGLDHSRAGQTTTQRETALITRFFHDLSATQQTRYFNVMTGGEAAFRTVALPGGGSYRYSPIGCNGSTWAVIYPEGSEAAMNALYVPQALALSASGHAEASAVYRKQLMAWSRCFTERTGLSVEGPRGAVAAAAGIYRRDGITSYTRARERTLSVASGACEFQVGLPLLRQHLMRRYAAGLPTTQLARLTAARVEEERAVVRARAVIGNGAANA